MPRERRVQPTHGTYDIRGRVVSLSFRFTHPTEDKNECEHKKCVGSSPKDLRCHLVAPVTSAGTIVARDKVSRT